MFYEIGKEITEIEYRNIDTNKLTVGIIKSDEFASIGVELGFESDTIEASQKANLVFRTGVDVRDDYTSTELRIINRDGHEDFVSFHIMKNLLLVVYVVDDDKSTINGFISAAKRIKSHKTSREKIIALFIESLISDGNRVAEQLRDSLTDMEELIVNNTADKDFNVELLAIKKRILKYYNYYSQIMDMSEILEENENELLDGDNLIYISNLSNKVTRLRDDINALNSMADHIQDAYATLLDQKMNRTMKVFTIITSIFFPLTIIVGWYGMNFENMPELTWRYGYLYVFILSIVTVIALIIIGKRKRWF